MFGGSAPAGCLVGPEEMPVAISAEMPVAMPAEIPARQPIRDRGMMRLSLSMSSPSISRFFLILTTGDQSHWTVG